MLVSCSMSLFLPIKEQNAGMVTSLLKTLRTIHESNTVPINRISIMSICDSFGHSTSTWSVIFLSYPRQWQQLFFCLRCLWCRCDCADDYGHTLMRQWQQDPPSVHQKTFHFLPTKAVLGVHDAQGSCP